MKQILQYGKYNHLLGIYEGDEYCNKPMIVMWNVGVISRTGPQRAHVELAREFKSRGHATFRFDASGRGESSIRSDYSDDFQRSVADVHETLDMLKETYAVNQFIIYGHCTSAVEGHVVTSERDDISALIMLDTYSYRVGKFKRLEIQRKLLGGRRYSNKLKQWFGPKTKVKNDDLLEGYYPPLEELSKDMDAFIEKNLPIYVRFTSGFSHLYNYQDQFYDMFPQLRGYKKIKVVLQHNTDHLFSRLESRHIFKKDLFQWLDEHFPSTEQKHSYFAEAHSDPNKESMAEFGTKMLPRGEKERAMESSSNTHPRQKKPSNTNESFSLDQGILSQISQKREYSTKEIDKRAKTILNKKDNSETPIIRNYDRGSMTYQRSTVPSQADIFQEQIKLMHAQLQLLTGASTSLSNIEQKAQGYSPSIEIADLQNLAEKSQHEKVIKTEQHSIDSQGLTVHQYLDGKTPSQAPNRDSILIKSEEGFPVWASKLDLPSSKHPKVTVLERALPLSLGQKEIFSASMVDLAFNESISWHFEGLLDKNRLSETLNHFIHRHDALRMTFCPDGSASMVAQSVAVHLDYLELNDKEFTELTKSETETPFDLRNGPLFRFKLVKRSHGNHTLIVTIHHIVCDGWSFGNMMAELKDIYEGKELSRAYSYADYVLNEVTFMKSPEYQREMNYWKQVYQTMPESVDLPMKVDRPRFRTGNAARIDHLLEISESRKLEEFARKNKVSLTTATLAVFRWLLAIKTKSTHIGIGIPAAGQSRLGSYGLIGHCAQLLPTYIDVPMETSFKEYLKLEKKLMLDAYDNQSITFSDLVKELKVPIDMSRIPLAPFKFNIDVKLKAHDLKVDGISSNYESNPRISEAFELYLNASKDESGILLETQYNTDLFSESMIREFISDYVSMIDSLFSNPDQTLSDLSILDSKLPSYPFNGTATEYDKDAFLHEKLIDVFTDKGQKVAIYTADESITYSQLQIKVESIAQTLIEQGVRESDCVAICCNRSVDMVAAMIGTLMVGATYIPMDPTFPKERLTYMVEDTRLNILLTDLEDRSALPAVKQIINLKTIKKRNFLQINIAKKADELLAYMIFTSGSTGRPKGVMVQHQAVHNFLQAVGKKLSFDEHETMLAVTTISFDISVLEIFLALFKGASIYLASKEEASNGESLKKIIEENSITIMQGTPSTWKILLASDFFAPKGFRALCGGEALSPNLAKALSSSISELWNMYGPTEATVWSSCALISPEMEVIHIGQPLDNYQYFILDSNKRSVPWGDKGELFIGGDSVSKGYLEMPELNAEKFLTVDETLLYNTGDIARFDKNGNIELFGRSDHQVKIRGYRIELGEIEEKIKGIPHIVDCIVKVFDLSEDDKRLVAFYTANLPIEGRRIRQTLLGESLPSYMIPNRFVNLDSFPLLPNGKINRNALQNPFALTDHVHEEPKDDGIREELRKIWRESLGTDVDDNSDFFDLGGHSMLGVQMTSRVNKIFGTQFGLKELFMNPSFGGFVNQLSEITTDGSEDELKIPVCNDDDIVLNNSQQRMWYLDKLNPGSNINNLPAAWSLPVGTDIERVSQALYKIISLNDALRLYVDDSSGLPIQRHAPHDHGYKIPQKHFEKQEFAHSYMTADFKAPINVNQFPIFVLEILTVTNGRPIIYFKKHHMIWDGWSYDIFLEKLARYYHNLEDRLDASLPRYKDYGVWADQYKQTEKYKEHLTFWKKELAELPVRLELPTTKTRGSNIGFTSFGHDVILNESKIERIAAFNKSMGITDFMFFIGCFYLFLSTKSGTGDLIIGTPDRGRKREDLNEVIGAFINVMPLRFKNPRSDSLKDYFQDIKKVTVNGLAHSDAAIEDIVASLDKLSGLDINELYSAMFSFQNAEQRVNDIGTGPLEQIYIHNSTLPSEILLNIKKNQSNILVGIEINRDLWNKDDAKRFSDDFVEVVNQVLDGSYKLLMNDTKDHQNNTTVAANPIDIEFLPKNRTSGLESKKLECSEIRETVRRIWSEHIGEEDIRDEDNFFALGGHSLMAIKVIARIKNELNYQLTVRDILNGTLQTCVIKIASQQNNETNSNIGPKASKKRGIVAKLFSWGTKD